VYQRQRAHHWRAVDKLLAAQEVAYRTGLLVDGAMIAAYQAAGYTYSAAQVALAALKLETQDQWARAEIQGVERRYVAGAASAAECTTALTALGVTVPAVARLLTEWAARLPIHHPQASAQQILGWVREGLMPPSVAQQRLAALGWTGVDAHLELASAEGRLAKSQAASARAAVQSRQKSVAALARVNKAMQAEIARNEAAIRRQVSLSTVARWLKKGQVSVPYYLEWAQDAGLSADVAAQHLIEWGRETDVATYLPGLVGRIAEQAGATPQTGPLLGVGPAQSQPPPAAAAPATPDTQAP
jgi:hypothetical protein